MFAMNLNSDENQENVTIEHPQDDQEGAGNVPEYLIEVVWVSKIYGTAMVSKNVLNGANLNILPGKIYVIYGAKDAGKSTLLKILAGLQVPTIGYVKYNLDLIQVPQKKVKIRYVPQSDGMFMNCTVFENVSFFGYLNNFSRVEVDQMYKEVINRLYISNSNMIIGQMDQMQRKRLSIFIPSMYAPHILLLDEPTTAIDPIVKHEHWLQMRFMQRTWNTTILLTSSDSEECLRSDFVSYLRHGHIVETARPNEILDKWSVDSMDKAFYCMAVKLGDVRDDHRIPPDPSLIPSSSWYERTKMQKEFRKNFPSPTTFLKSQKVLLYQNFLSIWRLKFIFLLLGVLIPIIILLFFYYSIGQETTRVVIGILKCQICEQVPDKKLIDYCSTVNDTMQKFPLSVLYDDQKCLERDMEQGLIKAILSYKMGDSICQGGNDRDLPLQVSYKKLNTPKSFLTVDESDRITSYFVKRFFSDRHIAINELSLQSDMAILQKFEDGKMDADKIIFGILALIIFHISAALSAFIMISGQKIDLINRLLVLGIRHFQIQITQWLGNLTLLSFECLFLSCFTLYLTNEDIFQVITIKIWLLSMCLSICGVSFGMLLSQIFTHYVFASVILSTFSIIALILCGILWPLEGLPLIFNHFSYLIPQKYTYQAYFGLIFKNFELDNAIFLRGYWTPLVWALIAYIIFLCNIYYKLNKI